MCTLFTRVLEPVPAAAKRTFTLIDGCFTQSIAPRSAHVSVLPSNPCSGVFVEPSSTDQETAFAGASQSRLMTPYGPGVVRKFGRVAFAPKAGVVQFPEPPGLVRRTSSTNHQSQQVPEP